jgi:AcrR family transcriptional regulator
LAKVSEAHLNARRQQILDAAIVCFARIGFHNTTMVDIAREAGLSTGLAYRYFSSKNEIIEATVSEGDGAALARHFAEEATEHFDDFRSFLDAITQYGFAEFEHKPGKEAAMNVRLLSWAEAIQNPEVREEVLSRWGHHLAVAKKWVRRAQDEGQIDPALDAHAVARIMLAIHDGFGLQWALDPDVDIPKYREAMLALFGGSFWHGEKDAGTD